MTEYVNYIVTNSSLLPVGVADTLAQLEAEWRDGDLTRRGYLRRRSQILDKYPHLLQTNGTVMFGPGDEGAGKVGGATRRLLSAPEVDKRSTVVPVKSVGGVAPGTQAAGGHLHGPLVSGSI